MNDRPIRRLTACGTSAKGSGRDSRDRLENVLHAVGVRNLWRCSVCGEVAHASRLVLEVGTRFPICEDWNACTDRVIRKAGACRG